VGALGLSTIPTTALRTVLSEGNHVAKAKLSMRDRYRLLTRDLDWEPTYVEPEKLYPHTRYEGIKIHDWDKWEDPFRLTVDSYSKYQA
jgi:phenol/toluene 2-monooxygenase (NADH) P3/A3